MANLNELQEKRNKLIHDAKAILQNEEATHDQVRQAKSMFADVAKLGDQIAQLRELSDTGKDVIRNESKEARQMKHEGFGSFAEFLTSVWMAGLQNPNKRYLDPRLSTFTERPLPEHMKHLSAPEIPGAVEQPENTTVAGWENQAKNMRRKAMAENVGADGGFLVPTEFRADVLAVDPMLQPIRTRASVIPMARRALQIPVLDQTSSTSGSPSWFGGLDAFWTEEAAEKNEDSPSFRQVELVAHELICYTRVSDALVADSAIALDAWLRSDMGFTGAIRWYEEYAFLQGTGAGQPLGVLNAINSPTIVQAASSATLAVADITGMIESFFGRNPVWHISRSQMSNLLELNGPAINPSYVFIPNTRDGAPATLMGFPIVWDDKLPAVGTQGNVLLADWNYYIVGDRQDTTIESTQYDRWRYNQTSWRAVHRVGGQPWMSAPITYSDGSTTVSPFVILGAYSAS